MKTPAALIFGLLLAFQTLSPAENPPEYLQSFDPEKGFKPAQRDLTEIFLQLAGSLEYYGSPEPYLRHMVKEHARIEAIYQQKFGKVPRSARPSYMTDQYIDTLSANWKQLSPKLGLDPFAKEIGNAMRDSIQGTRGTGTIIVEILNEHQARVFDAIAGNKPQPAGFEDLKSALTSRLELDKTQISDIAYSIPRRDAVHSASIIRGIVTRLFNRLDAGLKPADAERVETVLNSIIMDTGQMAQSELEAGIAEWAIDKSLTASK